jgi:hypothetical protein
MALEGLRVFLKRYMVTVTMIPTIARKFFTTCDFNDKKFANPTICFSYALRLDKNAGS